MNPTRSETALDAFRDSAKRVQVRLPTEPLTSGFAISRQPPPSGRARCGYPRRRGARRRAGNRPAGWALLCSGLGAFGVGGASAGTSRSPRAGRCVGFPCL